MTASFRDTHGIDGRFPGRDGAVKCALRGGSPAVAHTANRADRAAFRDDDDAVADVEAVAVELVALARD